MLIAEPDCARNAGSWCERIWRLWSVDWIASAADVVLTPALRIVLIIAIALVVRSLLHRAIDRLTQLTAQGFVPGALRPWSDRVEASVLGSASVSRRRERAESIGSLLKSVLSFVIVVVAFILVLSELGINVAPLLASAGIAGIAVGFGAQNLIRDFLAGIAMILEDQYGVGDLVDLGPATGTIAAVGLRTTTLRGLDGTIWFVRNGEILRVGNSSQGEPVVDVDFPLPATVDVSWAAEIAVQASELVASSPDNADVVLTDPEFRGVIALTHDSVTLRITTTIRPGSQQAYARALRTAVRLAFDREGLLLPGAGRPDPEPAPRDGASTSAEQSAEQTAGQSES